MPQKFEPAPKTVMDKIKKEIQDTIDDIAIRTSIDENVRIALCIGYRGALDIIQKYCTESDNTDI